MIVKKVEPWLSRAEKMYFWRTSSTEVGKTVLLNTKSGSQKGKMMNYV